MLDMDQSNYALIGRLSASLLHDILTPITSLTLSTSLLEKEHARDVGPIIDQSALQIKEFVDIMREFLQENDTERITHINKEIHKAILLMSHKANQHGVQIQFLEFDQIYSRVHPLYIYQILVNLISNAIDASSECATKKVIIVLKRDRYFYTIESKDFGIGIPAGSSRKIFKAGFTSKVDGFGFGLYSVKHIVTQLMYGELKIYSEPNEGSLFSCRLPIRK
jgi:signal transduction histidine kinase